MCKHDIAVGQCNFCSPVPKPVRPVKAKPVKAKVVKAPAVKVMTKAQFEKMCKDCRDDFEADEMGCSLADAAYDMADSMMYNSELMAYMKKAFPGANRQLLKEILADNIYG